MERMILEKFPKLFESFLGVSVLENLPRSTADASVGTTESLWHQIQNHTFARRLRKQFTQNLHHRFCNLSKATLNNFLRASLILHL
jgi:hypothetical protein